MERIRLSLLAAVVSVAQVAGASSSDLAYRLDPRNAPRLLKPPMIADRAERATFTRELIRLEWRRGDSINAYLIRPKGVQLPKVAIMLYGFPSDLQRWQDDAFCARVVAQGFAALSFDSAVQGDRYRGRPMREWFITEMAEALSLTIQDVYSAIGYLRTRTDLDTSGVGLFGQGSAGAVAIVAAARDPRIVAVDTLNPWGAWPEFFATTSHVPDDMRPRFKASAFQRSIAPLDPVRSLPALRGRPLRVQFVADDASVPPASQNRILNALATPHKQTVHRSNLELMRATGGGRLFQWLGGHLK